MSITLICGIDSWLNIFKKDTIKPSSFDRLKRCRNLLAKDPLSTMSLDSITKADLQQYLSRLNEAGYAPNTIKKQFTLLTAYFKHALSEGYMTRPIYLGVRMPKTIYEQEKEQRPRAYTEEEQRKLLGGLMTLKHPVYGALGLMLECGLRVGEALGLSWDCVDWDRRALTVSRTLVRLASDKGRTFVQRGAKSKASNRTIPLSPAAIDILLRMQALDERAEGLIFHEGDDPMAPLSYSCVVHHLQGLCRKTGVHYWGTHILRHTFATNCYHKGCDVKILSKLLGHADVNITYNTYIHLYGDALEEMRQVVERT